MKSKKQYGLKLQAELEAFGKEPYFEIEVINKEGGHEYLLCECYVKGLKFIGDRDSVSKKEERSKFISFSSVRIDLDSSLNEHLQELHDAVLEDIINGDLYQLA